MWASCCGLLNEVMGTGTVRAQQPGFGAGAGPFRFAPSAGYSTYPPTASGSAGQLCKACGLAFSVFRRKEELRCCSTCHLLRSTAFQRPRLMQLRVKDLRQYLLLRNISTDTCREKEDLVDLVLCHQGTRETSTPGEGEEDDDDEEEEDEEDTHEDDAEEDEEEDEGEEDTDSLHSLPHSRPASPPPPRAPPPNSRPSPPLRETSSAPEQEDTPTASLLNLEPTETLMEVSPATQRRIRASLSDLDNEEAIENLSVRQLKEILARNFVNYSGCCEKWELLERVHRLYRENEHNRKSMENVSITPNTCAVVAYPPPLCNSGVGDGVKAQLAADDNLCRICMDAIIDCVLLECGHMVTCTKCGKRMSECPICRQYVVRAVHVFKS
ncbi:hypothetical protein F7725_015634 [Dissostichus mawsoni]|uniref:RING-type domain-containing protein n=1 Tax=Dissostichus mawsoni TaxID=36200 RepID=A0A7J5YKW7_DISMA|nr:hypothetical protein F7725_015634 [Dissostichus mawsoni]